MENLVSAFKFLWLASSVACICIILAGVLNSWSRRRRKARRSELNNDSAVDMASDPKPWANDTSEWREPWKHKNSND